MVLLVRLSHCREEISCKTGKPVCVDAVLIMRWSLFKGGRLVSFTALAVILPAYVNARPSFCMLQV